MTIEQPNLKEKVSAMKQSICSNPELEEQLAVIALLNRGGAVTIIFDKQCGLQFIKQETQLKVSSQH